MSVDISSLPPWKQELLDKKRRQEEEERKKKAIEEDRLSKMPPWKRDIILRKQQQKQRVPTRKQERPAAALLLSLRFKRVPLSSPEPLGDAT